jgi:hypothetical protein
MAFIDSTPERLMPAPLALSRDLSREMVAAMPAAAPAPTPADSAAPEPVAASVGRRRQLETAALAAIVSVFAGLVFTLAIKAIGALGIALVVTALTLLPILSLGVVPSRKGR